MGYALDNARKDNSNEQLGNEWTHSLIKQVATAMIATDRIATTAKIDLSYYTVPLARGSLGAAPNSISIGSSVLKGSRSLSTHRDIDTQTDHATL